MNSSKVSKPVTKLPFAIGDKIIIRTVTMIDIGEVLDILDDMIVLHKGGWVADTGRFSKMLAEGTFSEFELAPGWICVGRGGIIDIFPWNHELPTKTV